MSTPLGASGCSMGTGTSIQFVFSNNGGLQSVVKTPIAEPNGSGGTNVIITSEDGTDNDDNDTFLTLTLNPVATGGVSDVQDGTDVVSLSQLHKFGAQGGLVLNTSVGYSNGLTSDINLAIGAFAGRSTFADFTVSTQVWGKVSGIVIDDTSSISRYNFLMLDFKLSEGKLAGLENATMSLRGFMRYSKDDARPAGQQSALWTAVLQDTDITVAVQ
ncbi:hypothetical protein B0H12DRAFT_1162917 [Mycena haematopus]|nr:hypothetical protein B0H12DRAFT_1162917 [Mycena haematopus]